MKPLPRQAEPLDKALQEIFEVRAARLRRTADAGGEDTAEVEWVAQFPVGEESFALRMDALVAALPLRLITPVPLAPPQVVGIFRHEGMLLPVYSLASLLGVRGWRQDPAVLLVLEVGQGRRVAVDCEQVPKPVALPGSALAQAADPGADAVRIVVFEGHAISLIDVGRLFEGRGR